MIKHSFFHFPTIMRFYPYTLLSFILYFPFSNNILHAQKTEIFFPTEKLLFTNSGNKSNHANLIYHIESGELRNIYAPELNNRYGIYISSVYSIGPTNLSGKAGYTRHQRKGQRYCSMFRQASPLITFADTLPGNSKGESYYLAGHLTHSFFSFWSIGLTGEYLAGNYAKDTDPRNKNNLNQITISPDFQYRMQNLFIGITLHWQYEREVISYKSFGSETKNGVTFYPLWFYTHESFTDGLNAQRDYRNNHYKMNFVLQYSGKTWQTTFLLFYAQGQTHIWINPAKKQSAGEITSKDYHIENITRIFTPRYIHKFIPHFSHSRHKIYDTQQQLSTDNRIYETILKIKRAEATSISAGFHYVISPESHPDRTIKTGVEFKKRNSLFRLPPIDFKQEIRQMNWSASYTRSFVLSGHSLKGSLQTNYYTGKGSQPDLSALSSQTIFHLQNQLLDREFQYLTASVLGISTQLTYILLSHQNKIDFYIEACNQFHTTFHVSGWSARANTFTCSAGILF